MSCDGCVLCTFQVHGFQVLSKELGPVISAYKPRLAEDGTEGGEEKLTDQD